MEDAPALDALEIFTVSERDGAVYIKGDQAKIKSGRKNPVSACKAQGQDQIVVVGG